VKVPSIDVYTKKVEELGGEIVIPKTELKGFSHFAICHDTDGNTFGLWE
jgi:predicted enzyme related to lactoylglutathione lyase